MTTTVQVATEADHPALAQLRSAVDGRDRSRAQDDAAFAGRFASWLDAERGRRTFWIARDGVRPVGMVNLLADRADAEATPAVGPLGLPREPLRAPRVTAAVASGPCSSRRS